MAEVEKPRKKKAKKNVEAEAATETAPPPVKAETAPQVEWTLGEEELAMNELGEPLEHEIFAAQENEVEEAPEEGLSEAEAAIADAELGHAEFIDEDRAVSIIESLLFTSDRPV